MGKIRYCCRCPKLKPKRANPAMPESSVCMTCETEMGIFLEQERKRNGKLPGMAIVLPALPGPKREVVIGGRRYDVVWDGT